jgi:hypothetical protein
MQAYSPRHKRKLPAQCDIASVQSRLHNASFQFGKHTKAPPTETDREIKIAVYLRRSNHHVSSPLFRHFQCTSSSTHPGFASHGTPPALTEGWWCYLEGRIPSGTSHVALASSEPGWRTCANQRTMIPWQVGWVEAIKFRSVRTPWFAQQRCTFAKLWT